MTKIEISIIGATAMAVEDGAEAVPAAIGVAETVMEVCTKNGSLKTSLSKLESGHGAV